MDVNELRDYSILLYHCGLYEQALEYLKLYQEAKVEFSAHDLNDLYLVTNRLRILINITELFTTKATIQSN